MFNNYWTCSRQEDVENEKEMPCGCCSIHVSLQICSLQQMKGKEVKRTGMRFQVFKKMDSTRDWIPNLSNSTYIRRVPKTSSLPFSRRLTSLQLRLEKERPENGKVRTKQHIILLVSWYSCKMTSRNKPFPDQLTRDSKVRSPHLISGTTGKQTVRP